MNEKKLKEKLKYNIPLRLQHFEKLYDGDKMRDSKEFEQLMFENKSAQELYNEFRDRVFASLGSFYLPIYRMADGEFRFCVSREEQKSKLKTIRRNIINPLFKRNYKGRKMPLDFKSLKHIFDTNYFRVLHGEGYSSKERKLILPKFVDDLKFISQKGLLAMHFIKANGKLTYPSTTTKMFDWLDSNKIILTSKNYTSFYFVYALLNGPDREHLYKNRNILIITNTDNEYRNKIENQLKKENVKNVEFYEISHNNSMKDKIDISKIKEKPELILIGGGVGSSNILAQLEPLNTTCIDAGINLMALAYPEIKKTRLFLKPYSYEKTKTEQ